MLSTKKYSFGRHCAWIVPSLIPLMLIIMLVSDEVDTTMGYITVSSPSPLSISPSKWTRRTRNFGSNFHLEMSRRPIQSQKNVAHTGKNLPKNRNSSKSPATAKGSTARQRPKGRPKKEPTMAANNMPQTGGRPKKISATKSSTRPRKRQKGLPKKSPKSKARPGKRRPKGRPRKHPRPKGKRRTPRPYRRDLWDIMYPKLQAFYRKHGHSRVTPTERLEGYDITPKEESNNQELYEWTRYMRHKYRLEAEHFYKNLDKNGSDSQSDSVTDTNSMSALIQERLELLKDVEFCWDYRSMIWETKYQELAQFYERNGHTRVSRSRHDKRLAIFCSNQRREYRKMQRIQKDIDDGMLSNTTVASTTLTPKRLEALNRIKFFEPRSYKTHDEMWHERFDGLQQYSNLEGDSHVPQIYPSDVRLGRWCMNQRTHHRYYVTKQASGMTMYRIHQLESVGFPFRYQQFRWLQKFYRLQEYQQQHGHLLIDNKDDSDLRQWLNTQRHLYNQRQQQQQYKDQYDSSFEVSSPLTEERITMLESIPDFSWEGRRTSGPSRADWSKLFVAIREKGIVPGSRAKTHMFDGTNPLHMEVTDKDVWTEDDLMALWNAEEDDDDEDLDAQQSYGVLAAETPPQ